VEPPADDFRLCHLGGQGAGKKVILSIGGAAGIYGFTSVADAQK
jgi:hypothetical protein